MNHIAPWRDGEAVAWKDRNPLNAWGMDQLYLQRFNVSRTQLDYDFLRPVVPVLSSFLEIGSSAGIQLQILRDVGYRHFTAVDLSHEAMASNQWAGAAADVVSLPFADNSFDMVFTSGTLMHVPPELKDRAMREMRRVTRRWIWGFELWEPDIRAGGVRNTSRFRHITWPSGLPDAWLEDYPTCFQKACTDVWLAREQIVQPIREKGNVHIMYLLEKNG